MQVVSGLSITGLLLRQPVRYYWCGKEAFCPQDRKINADNNMDCIDSHYLLEIVTTAEDRRGRLHQKEWNELLIILLALQNHAKRQTADAASEGQPTCFRWQPEPARAGKVELEAADMKLI